MPWWRRRIVLGDSRYFGLVPRDHVKARAAFIYWSWDRERGLRAGRLFQQVR